MTNEEMTAMVQAGQTKWLHPLWERVSRLCAQLACRYYNRNTAVCRSAGVTDDDLMQEAYFGFIEAIKAYRPESGYLFISYLRYPLLNCFRAATGQRTAKGSHEPLSHAVSLNAPNGKDDSLTLGDMLQDDTTAELFERIEVTDIQRIVREEVAQLTDESQREGIISHYLRGLTYKQIASQYGRSTEQIRQAVQIGLRKLRTSKRLCELYGEFRGHGYDLAMNRIMYQPEYFELIRQIRERQKREYISYGKQQAMLYDFLQRRLGAPKPPISALTTAKTACIIH